MPRRVRDKNLDTREARRKLPLQGGKCHWRMIDRGVHLGYRKLAGKPGSWTSRVYVGNQHYRVQRIGTADDLADADGNAVLSFSQAQDRARRLMVRHARDANGTAPITVRRAIELYCESVEHGGRPATAAAARRIAEKYIAPVLGDVEVSTLKPEVIRAWLGGLAKGTKPIPEHKDRDDVMRARRSSANKIFSALRAALNFAFHEGKVDADPWRKVKPLENATAARIHYLEPAEAQRLVNACDPAFRNLVQAALVTGARYSELCRCKVSDFYIAEQKQEDGSVLEIGTLAIRQSKSGKPRHIILNNEGTALFTDLCAGRSGSELILRRAGGLAWGPSNQQAPMVEAVKRARVSKPISFHSLRHTYASLCAMAGVPLTVIAKNLGHADTQMCQKHYAHFSASYETKAILAGAPTFGFERTNVARLRQK